MNQPGPANCYLVYNSLVIFGVLHAGRVKKFWRRRNDSVLKSKFGQMGIKAQGHAFQNSASIKRAATAISIDASVCNKSEVFDFESPAIQEFNEGSNMTEAIKAFPVSEIPYKT